MKGLGYLISTLSVVLLGVVAWPKPDEPKWKIGLVVAGMATSILGMFLRFLSHRKQERELKRAKRSTGSH
jgi:uncharacterized membrane protein YhhN